MKYFKHAIWYAVGAAVLLGASQVGAQEPAGGKTKLQALTIAVETSAGAVALPGGPTGSLVMATCAGCPLQSFEVTENTLFLINRQPASLAELRAAMLENPQGFLGVTYDVKTNVVTEIHAAR